MPFSPITMGRVVRARRAGTLTFTQAEHAPRSALAMHAHERANLTFVLSGAFGERLPGHSFAVAVHEIVVKAAGEPHANDYGNAAARSLTIEFDDAWRARGAGVLERSGHYRSAGAADALLRALCEVARADDDASAASMEELVLGAVAELARVPLATRDATWIADVRAFLDEQYLEPVSLTTVAETFGLERTLLARTFRHELGTTVGGYVRRLRVQHACRELAASARPVAEIAASAGFADHAHLCRVFKESLGRTPTEFRRLQA